MVRFADDFVVVLQREADARRILDVLPRRLAKFGLTLYPEKARVVRFVRPDRARSTPAIPVAAAPDAARRVPGTVGTLGGTHDWGNWRTYYGVVKRKTARSRLRRGIAVLGEWCRRNLHRPVAEQYRTLCQKPRRHFTYYEVTGDSWTL